MGNNGKKYWQITLTLIFGAWRYNIHFILDFKTIEWFWRFTLHFSKKKKKTQTVTIIIIWDLWRIKLKRKQSFVRVVGKHYNNISEHIGGTKCEYTDCQIQNGLLNIKNNNFGVYIQPYFSLNNSSAT